MNIILVDELLKKMKDMKRKIEIEQFTTRPSAVPVVGAISYLMSR